MQAHASYTKALGGQNLRVPQSPCRAGAAEQVAGAEYIEMKNLGHFPMSENYPLFKPYLTQTLDIIGRKLP